MIYKKSFVVIFFIILLSLRVYSYAGVSPTIYEVDFKPNLTETFFFNFFGDQDTDFKVYAEGNLAKYVNLSTNHITGGSGRVESYLSLPEAIDIPGTHRIYISAQQINNNKSQGFAILGTIRGVIKVNVPYPGKYIEADFSAASANAGQSANLSLILHSKGKEIVSSYSFIDIYDFSENKLQTITIGEDVLESGQSAEHLEILNTKNYTPGSYKAIAVVNYDNKIIKEESVFRLGELFVNISNYTSVFSRNKINRFEIEAESFWNDQIENVFADVKIAGYDISFLTPSITLGRFQKSILTGFFDTTNIKEDKFQVKITVHYQGKATERVADLEFRKEPNYALYALIGAVILLIIILILYFARNKLKKKRR